MNTRFFRTLVVMTVLGLIVAACAPAATPVPPTSVPQPTQPPASPTSAMVADLKGRSLKIGSDTTYPPFEFVDTKTQKIVGFDVDMVNEICKLINCTAQFVTTNFDTIFVALAQKQFDMVASGVTITDERKKTIDFGDSYLKYGETLLIRTGDTTVKSKDDLKNTQIIVGVQTGTSNEQTALKLVADQQKQIKRYDTFDQAVAALIAGDINCVEIDRPAALGYMATNPGKIETVKDDFTSDDLAFAFQKGDKEMVDAFNAGLKAIRDNGTYDKIKDFWFNKWTAGAPIP
jgi:polar amino acid transport system substrate-binding protein